MDPHSQRARLAALVAESGHSLAALSRVLGRNPAYLQQYLGRGSPRTLPEGDRARLAAFLGVAEAELGGPTAATLVSVPRLDVLASAGPGAWAEDEARQPGLGFPPAFLRTLGVRPDAASMLRVVGDSMLPTLSDGDEILVDRDRRRIDPHGIFVLRLERELLVKRLRAALGGVEIVSDNPAYPLRIARHDAIEILGRVAWLGRAL